ncbi:MAG TPA: hypothetical protein VE993_10775 [Stellaceae bacterium]|nr:hypothetical protein [Stellaceae bacterium]
MAAKDRSAFAGDEAQALAARWGAVLRGWQRGPKPAPRLPDGRHDARPAETVAVERQRLTGSSPFVVAHRPFLPDCVEKLPIRFQKPISAFFLRTHL